MGPGTSGESARPEPPTTPALLDTLVLVEMGEPVCEDASQCRMIALGAKPCGGPWSHLVCSARTTDSIRLVQAVARYNQREATLNRKEGRV